MCDPIGIAPKADWVGVDAALGRVVAPVPESTIMDVYNRCRRLQILVFLHT